MIHFPHHWLRCLETASNRLNTVLGPFDNPTVIAALSDLEFRMHVSLFAARKIEESIGIALNLSGRSVEVSSWPVTEERKVEICRSADPDFAGWYQLQASERWTLSYKRVIDLFVHARICNFVGMQPVTVPLRDAGVFVSSDHTMKGRIFFMPAGVVDGILQHAISIFRPVVKKRDARGV